MINNKNLYDVIIVGGGPAGLTAAIYLARAKYRVVVIEKEHFGGQITITSEVVNYPGIERIDGKTLTENMRKQAQSFGAEFMIANAEKLDISEDIKKVYTDKGILECFGILIATGAHPRSVGFEGEQEFKGHGVAYCATCDGEFFDGKEVFVLGGGFAAAEEGVFLTKYASHVTILIRGNDFSCAQSTADHARNHEKISVLTNTEVLSVRGNNVLDTLIYRDKISGKVTEYKNNKGFGVFVFAGYEPETQLIKGLVELSDRGYVITDKSQKTSVDGIYAAGDVCEKGLRQVITACGDGAQAATELEKYSAKMQEKTGLKPEQPDKEEKAVNKSDSSIFSDDVLTQLNTVFSKMENSIILRLYLDERPVSTELKNYMEELSGLTDKLSVEILSDGSDMPCVKVCREDGSETGLAFHGVPGGHEFTSFILGLYNAAGEGQAIDEESKDRIMQIDKPKDIKIMVSLSCTMCPELVTAAQKIASVNKNVTAEVYDLNYFSEMREKYNVMSVPCMVINSNKPQFGKKNIKQLIEILEKE